MDDVNRSGNPFYQTNDQVNKKEDHVISVKTIVEENEVVKKHINYGLKNNTVDKNNEQSLEEDATKGYDHVKENLNTFVNHVRPACLPRPDWDLRARSDCWLAGWGYFKIEEYKGNSLIFFYGFVEFEVEM